jgi:hypothetical protein
MDTPMIHRKHPSVFPTAFVAALAGTILMLALVYAAPALGVPLVDYPLLLGGVFSADPGVALGLGAAIFLALGVLVLGLVLALAWTSLPGDPVAFRGAALKGLLFGLALWVLSGLLLPALGAVSRLDVDGPGLFALDTGPLAALWLLVLHLAYGLATALVAAMAQGVAPGDVLGWMWTSHGGGESP